MKAFTPLKKKLVRSGKKQMQTQERGVHGLLITWCHHYMVL